MEKIISILQKYTGNNSEIFCDTVSMLCSKGVANGCYQDYSVLMDLLDILVFLERETKK